MAVFPKRSSQLLDRGRSLLLIVDLQEKLLSTIGSRERIAWNARRLLSGANALHVPHRITEQYPERLGATVTLSEPGQTVTALSKRMFSCRECFAALEPLRESSNQVVLCGIESHVCVLQTALDLIAEAWQVFIVADAIGSRSDLDHSVAMERMMRCGAVLTTTESVLFEWCESSTAPEFKVISALVRQTSPQ